jgi:hypothetical protein
VVRVTAREVDQSAAFDETNMLSAMCLFTTVDRKVFLFNP